MEPLNGSQRAARAVAPEEGGGTEAGNGSSETSSGPQDQGEAQEQALTVGRRKWSGAVTTDSTHPPAGLFTKDAATIARSLASPRVSPKGPGSGMRMLNFFVNRAGRQLSPTRR